MNRRWLPDQANRPQSAVSAEVRQHAVSDVLGGMSIIGAAVVWGVLAADLERWVEAARNNAEAP